MGERGEGEGNSPWSLNGTSVWKDRMRSSDGGSFAIHRSRTQLEPFSFHTEQMIHHLPEMALDLGVWKPVFWPVIYLQLAVCPDTNHTTSLGCLALCNQDFFSTFETLKAVKCGSDLDAGTMAGGLRSQDMILRQSSGF